MALYEQLSEQAVADGVRIYHLNIGQPDLPIPQELIDGIRRFDGPLLPYAPSQGISETVTAWQAYYAQLDIALERNELLVTSGRLAPGHAISDARS